MWINNGVNNQKRQKCECIPAGWNQGRILSRNTHKWINDGIKSTKLLIFNPIPDGWQLGRVNKTKSGPVG